MNIQIFFEWETPSGIGPEFFIQSYNISILSSEYGYNSYNVTSATTTLNVTLNYNVDFTASVVSVNCAGESEPLILSDIRFG